MAFIPANCVFPGASVPVIASQNAFLSLFGGFFLFSAFPDKLRAAVRTGDRDFAPALRHAQALMTVRAFEVPMGLAVAEAQHGVVQATRNPIKFAST